MHSESQASRFILSRHANRRVCLIMRILPCLLLALLILMTGCGVKGDLYVPEVPASAGREENA